MSVYNLYKLAKYMKENWFIMFILKISNKVEKKWYWKELSANSNITLQNSSNKFTKQNQIFQDRIKKYENEAATVIQRFYLQRIYNPEYSFIQNKLHKVYEEYKNDFKEQDNK